MKIEGNKLVLLFLICSLMAFSGNLMSIERKYGEGERKLESSRRKIKISFKLSGGLGYLLNGAGDLNRVRKSYEAYLKGLEEESLYSYSFDWKKLSIFPNWKVDLIINISPNIGIGFGSGVIVASNEGELSLDYNNVLGDFLVGTNKINHNENVNQDYKITAIPINFDFYYFKSIGKSGKYTFFGYTGVGYYLGRLIHDYEYKELINIESFSESQPIFKWQLETNSRSNSKIRCNSLGLNGGLGLEMRISSIVSLGVELFGRYVNFNNWEGDRSVSLKLKERVWFPKWGWNEETSNEESAEHGFLWTFDVHNEDFNKDYTTMLLWEEKPSESFIRNTRKASLNLNTLGIIFSIKFYLDLF